MGLALDEPQDSDKAHEVDGIHFVVSQRDAPYVDTREGVSVDYVEYGWGSGFVIRKRYGAANACC